MEHKIGECWCKCKVCEANLFHGDCGNCHTYCNKCDYHNGIDGEYIPEGWKK